MGRSVDAILVLGFELTEDDVVDIWEVIDNIENDDRVSYTLFGSEDYESFIIGPKDCNHNSSIGEISFIDASSLDVDPVKIKVFSDWCGENNIAMKNISWMLVGYYG